MGYKTEFFGRVSLANGNSTTNPVDGSGASHYWLITNLPRDRARHFISATVYAEPNTITPIHPNGQGPQKLTAGTVKIEASDDGVNFGDITDGTINLATADYKRPNMCGPLYALRVTVTGVTPHTYVPDEHIPAHGVTVRIQVNSYE